MKLDKLISAAAKAAHVDPVLLLGETTDRDILSARAAAVYVARWVHRLPPREIAAAIGRENSFVNTALARAKRELADGKNNMAELIALLSKGKAAA